MITLMTYPAMGNAFSLSPFCCKAALMLDYAGVAWHREDMHDPRRMPYGKLPAIRAETGQIIGDSDQIRVHLEHSGVILDRWEDPSVWKVIRARYFETIPFPMRNVIANGLRRTLLAGMKSQGIGRLSAKERLARVEQDLTAVGDLLAQNPFLLGPTVSLADFSMGPILNAMRQTPIETPLALRVAGDAALVEYIDRVQRTARPAELERISA